MPRPTPTRSFVKKRTITFTRQLAKWRGASTTQRFQVSLSKRLRDARVGDVSECFGTSIVSAPTNDPPPCLPHDSGTAVSAAHNTPAGKHGKYTIQGRTLT